MSTALRRFIADWLWLIVVVILVVIPVLFAPLTYAMIGALLLLPAFAFIQWVRQIRNGTFRQRRNAMLRLIEPESMKCLNCRYSLVGLPPDAACPECGFAERNPRTVLHTPGGMSKRPASRP